MAEEAPLQAGWEEYESAGGEKYYFHPGTQETTWDRPVVEQEARNLPPVPPPRDTKSSSPSSPPPPSLQRQPSPLHANSGDGRGGLLAGIRGFGKGGLRKASRDSGAGGGSGDNERKGTGKGNGKGRTMSVQDELGAVLERRRNDAGTLRLKIPQGWVSEKTGGTTSI